MAKITIELNTESAGDEEIIDALVTALNGDPVAKVAQETARALHAKATEETTDDAYDPDTRIFGEKGAKSRRTKEEMAEDEDIAERWAALWPSKPNPPAKPVWELKIRLAQVEAREQEQAAPVVEEEGGFSVDDDEQDVMDLDEFRALLQKGMKKLGGKELGEIMAPHQNATSVPEEERVVFAKKITEALEDV